MRVLAKALLSEFMKELLTITAVEVAASVVGEVVSNELTAALDARREEPPPRKKKRKKG